jgi:hypothetical protein
MGSVRLRLSHQLYKSPRMMDGTQETDQIKSFIAEAFPPAAWLEQTGLPSAPVGKDIRPVGALDIFFF